MLVLGRRLNESIIINDNIKVIVLEVNGRQVKLGFEAPPEISIHRRVCRYARYAFRPS